VAGATCGSGKIKTKGNPICVFDQAGSQSDGGCHLRANAPASAFSDFPRNNSLLRWNLFLGHVPSSLRLESATEITSGAWRRTAFGGGLQ
jgi:hypothetical protein